MRSLLLVFVCFLPAMASAQLKISTSPKFVTTHSYEKSSLVLTDEEVETNNRNGFGVDVLASYTFKFGITISSGVDYTNYKWEWVESTTQPNNNTIMHNEALSTFAVPIYIDYGYSLGKFTPYAGAGVLIGALSTYTGDLGVSGQYKDNNFKNPLFIAFRIGFNYNLSECFYTGIGMNCRAMSKNIDTFAGFSSKLSSLNLGITLGYKF